MSKRTFQPHKTKRSRVIGFLVRMKSSSGAKVIKRRRQKGRSRLSTA